MYSELLGLGLGVYDAYQQGQAAQNAANLQQQATNQSLAQLAAQFNQGQANIAPWQRAGRSALDQQMALMGLGGDTNSANAALYNSPGYQFGLQQGNQALAASTAARGGMGSGKAMQAAQQWGQNYATGQRGNRLAELAGLSGQGLGAGGSMASMGNQYAQNYGNMLTQNANAQAAAGLAGSQSRMSSLLGGAQFGMNLADYNRNQNGTGWQPATGQQWAFSPQTNYSGPGLAWPY